ncbi:MAG: helix-turn-helix transcriptional regulator [Gemmatimonadota bacterium]|nr:MAG: helix-turn-helix transcriptional regulator [Gemmatimonadota bacterium]
MGHLLYCAEGRRLTQVQLAEKSGIHQSVISRIEAGTSAVSLDILERLCSALRCEPGELIIQTKKRR